MTTAPYFKAKVSLWKGRGKSVTARGGGLTKGKQVFQIEQASDPYKLTVIVVVTACTRFAQGVREIPTWRWEADRILTPV